MDDAWLVVTSINPPNAALRALSEGCRPAGMRFIVIGDAKSPPEFRLDGAEFLGLAGQRRLPWKSAAALPLNHYSRKNLGYLAAIAGGARVIVETDDDNLPYSDFFAARARRRPASPIDRQGWVNVYSAFTDAMIWPRGLPLEVVRALPGLPPPAPPREVDGPIQQGLADDNPDVDAVYRLLFPLPQRFRQGIAVALPPGAWCPFNSQNTSWWRPAFPLLYLPSCCSIRATDIWRSFVAQRVAWEAGWPILFHSPTVWQERNAHALIRDFADEVEGYLNNERIRKTLEDLPLASGAAAIADNLRRCYDALIGLGVIPAGEQALLAAWLDDLLALRAI